MRIYTIQFTIEYDLLQFVCEYISFVPEAQGMPSKTNTNRELGHDSHCKNDGKETWKNLYANWWFAFCVRPSGLSLFFRLPLFLLYFSPLNIKLLLYSFSCIYIYIVFLFYFVWQISLLLSIPVVCLVLYHNFQFVSLFQCWELFFARHFWWFESIEKSKNANKNENRSWKIVEAQTILIL